MPSRLMQMNRLSRLAGILAIGLLAQASLGAQQRKQRKVPAPPSVLVPTATSGWSKSAATVDQMAAVADGQFHLLKHAGASILFKYQETTGGHGFADTLVEIGDDKNFKIQYPVMRPDHRHRGPQDTILTTAYLIADGTKVVTWTPSGGAVHPMLLSKARYATRTSIDDWINQFPLLIFSGVLGGHPFAALVDEARMPGSGLTASIEERKFDYRGHIVHQRHIVIKGTRPSGSTVYMEIVFDASLGLPVTIRTAGHGVGGIQTFGTWEAQWAQVKNGFPASTFKVPVVTKQTTTKTVKH